MRGFWSLKSDSYLSNLIDNAYFLVGYILYVDRNWMEKSGGIIWNGKVRWKWWIYMWMKDTLKWHFIDKL